MESKYSCSNCGREKGSILCCSCTSEYIKGTGEYAKPLHWYPIDLDKKNIMSHETFKKLLEELDGNSVATLAEKNARYSSSDDALHNFRSGGDILGGTPAQACWGYLTKHLTALRDMIQKDDFSNREDFLEKCQDTINYIRFLWCIGNDQRESSDSVTKKQ